MGLQVFTPADLLKTWSDSARESSIEARGGKVNVLGGKVTLGGDVVRGEAQAGKINVLGGKVTLGGDVVPASNALGARDTAPGFAANLAIQKEEDKQTAAAEKERMATRISTHPPIWLPKEKHSDWKDTMVRHQVTSYKQAVSAFKAHERKTGEIKASQRAAKIREVKDMYAARWRNKQ